MSSNTGRTTAAIRALGLIVIALHLLAPLFEERHVWGLWPATYLPPGWRWGGAALAATLVLIGPSRLRRPLRAIPLDSHVWRAVLALASAAPFVVWRIRHLRWGDAYILANSIPHPEVQLTYTWQAPLDVFVHAKLWAAGHRLLGWADAVPAYTVLSSLAGVAFVWILLGFAVWLGRGRAETLLTVGLVGTLGVMQLFFGYIENYSLMTVGVLAYLWLALRTLKGEIPLWAPATVLAATHAFHPSTIILAPTLLWVAWRSSRRESGRPVRRPWARWLVEIALPYAAVLGGVIALMTAGGHGLEALTGVDAPGGGDRSWFVPLRQVSTRWEHYTLFSWGHLVDIVNQQLLVAPVIWPSLLLCFAGARHRIPWRDPGFIFLGLSSVLYLLLTLTWNPDYGGQRDWDLFAPAAVPAAMWLVYTLPRTLSVPEDWRAAGWSLVSAQAFHTAAWIYQNTRPWSWS
ncbi:MAG: hypothetical protein GX605_13350 [Chloroflexi bacterium]|nr:hypothetical protein [Chloroflexota bacterium]